MRPVEYKPAAIEAQCQDVTPKRKGAEADHQDNTPLWRPIADE